MTVHTPLRELTLPEALMAFVHGRNGVPLESVKPGQLTAAAEIAELVVAGHARIEGDRLVVDAPASSDRAWVREVTADLAGRSVGVGPWIKKRRDALATQQAEAAPRGVLVQGRKKLLGMIPYGTSTVDPAVRDALVEHLTGPGAETDPRAAVLARLLVTSKLHLRHRLGSRVRSRLVDLSERAPADTPAPAALSALDLAIGTVIYTTVISE